MRRREKKERLELAAFPFADVPPIGTNPVKPSSFLAACKGKAADNGRLWRFDRAYPERS